ncbi:putative chitin deacetylase [Spiroplasma helicoides]|uniref:Putative chitin deacetylase n=1 Tax=Spiroplasma helicoides TaxID=216938 RepID=A0A1B3SJM7_9MOLU|nr:polysaccharide deacetylase family protein [Spiroplasma helicoides]AOG60128.1 putative chitin deacetylase [Spiroplasma helicoides]
MKTVLKKLPYIFLALLLFGFFMSLVLYGAKDTNSYVVNKIKSDKKVCMLTFDDGPNLDYDNEIMDILQENEVEGTFFYVGKNIEKNDNNKVKQLFKRILDNGSYIGNHTYSHSKYQFRESKLIDEINKTDSLIKANLPKWEGEYHIPVRMSYLQFYLGMGKVLNNINRSNFIEGYLSGDWKFDSIGKEKIVTRYMNNVSGKNILVMHSTKYTKEYLPEVIKELKEKEYSFATFNPKSKNYFKNYGELA